MTPWQPGRTLFLVEEGQANQGDVDLARRMVELAAGTGAGAIEFQFGIADDLYAPSHPNHAVYRSRELTDADFRVLADAAHASGLLATASPLSDRLPERLAAAGYDALTLNSSDVTNPRMTDAVAATGLPVLLGTAMAELDEIDWAVERLAGGGAGPLCLLHGQHVMTSGDGSGVPESAVSLGTIGFLRARYNLPVGFVDHTSALEMPALAAAHGAAVVTKHLAPEAGWRGPDWHVCLTPDRMAEAVRLVRTAETAEGGGGKRLAEGEAADRAAMRRSIVAALDIPAGTVLEAEHLAAKRPGDGLDPRRLDELVGRTLRHDVGSDEQLRIEDAE